VLGGHLGGHLGGQKSVFLVAEIGGVMTKKSRFGHKNTLKGGV
jgi:hypothetical protein